MWWGCSGTKYMQNISHGYFIYLVKNNNKQKHISGLDVRCIFTRQKYIIFQVLLYAVFHMIKKYIWFQLPLYIVFFAL